MEVRSGRARVPSVADAGDDLASFHLLTLGKPRRVSREVGVIIHPLLVGRSLIDSDPAPTLAEEKFLDRPVGSGNDRRPFGGHDVDGVMTSPRRTGRVEGVG